MELVQIGFQGNPNNRGTASLRVTLLSKGQPVLSVAGPNTPHPRGGEVIGSVREWEDVVLWSGAPVEADKMVVDAFDIDGRGEGIVLTDVEGKTHFYGLAVRDERWQSPTFRLTSFPWLVLGIGALILAMMGRKR